MTRQSYARMGGYSGGPYEVRPVANKFNPSQNHAIYNARGRPVVVGTKAEMEALIERYHLGYAEWLMVKGTKAEEL